jgi:hypothetical protein
MKKFSKFIIAFLIFTLVYFAFRIPSYPIKAEGEDGNFIALIMMQPKVPDYLNIARIDGVDIFLLPIHPALNYELIRQASKLLNVPGHVAGLPPFWVTTACRFVYSLFEYVAFALFFSILFLKKELFQDKKSRNAGLAALVIFSISPLAVHTSTYLQIDNSSGALLMGLFSILIFLATFLKQTSKGFYPVLFIAGILTGFGKNEWTIFTIMALASAGLIIRIFPKIIEDIVIKKKYYAIIAVIFAGCLVGNIINWRFGPDNFTGGLGFIYEWGKTSSLSLSEKWIKWLHLTSERTPLLISMILAQIIVVYALFIRRKPMNFFILILLLCSLIFFSIFFFSLIFAIPRYFAPALMITVITLIAVRLKSWDRRVDMAFYGLLLFTFAHSILFTAHRFHDTFVIQYTDSWVKEHNQTGQCIPLKESIAFLADGDFIVGHLKVESQRYLDKMSATPRNICP